MANQNLSNRSKTIRLATLSGLYPMQCRKSGAIMFSNGVQAIFVPENRNFTRDEEIANIVSLCNANALGQEVVDGLVAGIKEDRSEEVYSNLAGQLVSKFSKEESTKRHNRANFIDGVAYTQKYTDILQRAGISVEETEEIVAELFADSKTIANANVYVKQNSAEENEKQ